MPTWKSPVPCPIALGLQPAIQQAESWELTEENYFEVFVYVILQEIIMVDSSYIGDLPLSVIKEVYEENKQFIGFTWTW